MKYETTIGVKVSLLAVLSVGLSSGQVSVLTQRNDNARTGQNLNETILNTSNVNQNTFGKLFWRTVDGFIYAQPLYVPGLTIQGSTHNVVFVATQHNSVYAFDADDPAAAAPLWQVNLGTPVPSQDICILTGDTDPADCPYYDISPEIGITGTPAIDPVAGIIYVVSRTKNTSNSTYHDYIHALDLTTGSERLGGPVEITGQVSGTGDGSQGGTITFDPSQHNQRPALLLLNGVLYLCFGSVGDIGTWHGWVMAYNATSLQQNAIFNVAPDGSEGGVWSAGQGPVADAAGNVYIMTGNGDFNANVAGGRNYGDSFVKFSGSSLTVADYFTPSNQGTLNMDNTDLGSGGTMLMPGTSLLVGMGKDGILRVVDSTNMGKYNAGVDNDVQEFTATPNPFYSSPIYWNSPNFGPVVYIWGAADYLKAFEFTGSKFQTIPVSQGTILNSTGESNAAALSVSANGSQVGSGILWSSASLSQWASGVQVPGVVRAFDATNLANELWDSSQNLTRDDVGNSSKFSSPTIANGKVYAASFSGQLQVYGLNPPPFHGIQFIQAASSTPQSTTASVSVAYPGSQTVGDLNVVIVGWNDSTATIKSVTDTLGNTYALAAGPITGTALSQAIYYAKNIVGGSNTITIAFNQSANKPDLRILEYSGLDTSSPLDVSTGATGTSNIADSGFVATNAANELIIGASMVHSNTTVMAGAPFTPRIITSPDSDLAADRLVNVAGSYHAWAPLNSSGAWLMQMATFRAVISGTAPVVSNVSPNSGPLAGGTAVTIAGTNFGNGATVIFGGVAATNITVVNSGTITATTPAGNAGAVTVTVTNPNTQTGSLSNGFTYTSQPGPTVNSVAPNNGPATGGTSLTITGTNFASGATVTFGGTAATNVVVVNSTSITATTPAHAAGAVTVTVTVNGQSGSLTNGFTYNSSIAISFAQVASATPQSPTATVAVSYPAAQTTGDLNVVVVGWNDTTATVQSVKDSAGNNYIPAIGPTTGTGLQQSIYYAANIVGGSNTVTVTFSAAAAYPDIRILEYRGVTGLDVTAGASGSSATANSGAATTTIANELIFGANMVATGNAAPGSGFTSRIITSPDGDLAEDKIVTTAGSNSATATLTSSGPWVMQMATFSTASGPVPTLSSLVPGSGSTAGGAAVTITGTNFVTGATVTFGSTAATNVAVVNGTTMTATTPPGSAGAVTVTVTNPGGQSAILVNGFTYIAPPTVSSVAPSSGPPAGGTAVTITGASFAAGATVTFGGAAATNVVVVNSTTITATTPAGTGAVTVTVTNSNGLSGSLPNAFTYIGPPTVSAVSPNTGPTVGGTTVTIAGTNFLAGATVTFGSTAATNVAVVNGTTITATTPAGSAGAMTVTVTVGGQSGSLANGFTYVIAPTVSTVAPNSGPAAGGTAVTITGTNFATGATVKFGTAAATNVMVVSGTQITATTPAGSAGAVTITVTVNGQSGSLANGFTYVVAPTVSSVSPNSGSTAGGTAVTITGTNFAAGATVTFGAAAATNAVVVSGTQITATTPAGSTGAVTVTVTNVGSQSGSLANGYTYVVAPTVSSVAPNSGPVAGGTAVTITGTNFAAGATVKFGTTAATNVVLVSGTQITAATPAGSAGAVSVTVTVNGQSGSLANGFTYVAAPTVSSVSPNSGSTAGGTAVTITGTKFAAGATVTFGAAAATNVVVVSGTQITATTPAGSTGAVTVTVTNVGSQSGSLANGYTYVVVPTVSSVAPNSGPVAGGTAVTITGTNFAAGATVKFGTTAATNVVVVSGTQITATVPAHSAGAVTVTVTVSGQSGSLTNGFTFLGSPTVTSVSPNSGPTAGGTTVTITGTNFATGATVKFGTKAATNVVVVSVTQITATTPAGSAGAVTVTVTVSGKSGSLASGFTYTVGPTVSSVSPNNGPAAGGTAVTITGTSFAAGATVKFGTTAAANVVVVSGTQITATTPAGSPGAVSVTVTANGQSGSLTNGFTYVVAPTVTSVSPNSGSTAGGTAATITGTNFAAGATVTFGAAAATNVVVVSGTQITATTPAGSAGAVTVTVTNVGSQSGSLANGYTYVVAPTVSSVGPNSGPVAGGTAVTITGTNFATGATVKFGTTAATNVVVVNGTQITATTPAGSAGAVTITVTVNGQSGSLANGFTYVAAPTVSSVSPNSGSTAGGTAVAITGTNFAAGATVTFGAAAATNVVVVSGTQITATTPAGSTGAVTVTVTNVGSQSGSLANGYTYAVAPMVNSVAPNSGPVAGGTAVTITGTNFAAAATVTFAGTAATNVVVVNSTTITATTPAGSTGAVTLTVTVNGQSGSLTNGFTYTGTVAISFTQVASVTPQSPTATVGVSYPGAQTAGDMNVVVVGWNDTTAMVQSVKDSVGNNYILAIGPTTGTGLQQSIYYAANILGGSNTVTVTFSTAAAYPDIRILEYRGVTGLDVTAGASGSSATANSGAATTTSANELIFGANTVTTGNAAAGSGFTARIITAQDGDLAEDKIVTTVGSNGATATLTGSGPWVMQMVAFSVVSGPVPTVSSMVPGSGSTAGGTAVTITGTNFVTGATVTFGSTAATNVAVVNGTTITATSPAGSASAVTVTVTNPGGQSASLVNGFTYIAPPTVSSVAPSSGPMAGGTAVAITGTSFAAGATVTFGGTAATNVVVVNSTTITATTPAGNAGGVTVTVTDSNRLSGSSSSAFTYIAPPTVSSVNPNTGPTAGGTGVTITGTNFLSGTTVTFGGTAATNVSVVNGTTITATTPAGSAGAVTVTVTVGGQSGSLTSGFTYSNNTVVVTSPGNFAGSLLGTSAPTYVSGQEYYNATAGTSFISAPFNSTGADLLVIMLGCHNRTVFTITDTYGNTWLPLSGPAYKVGNASFPMEAEVFYAPNAVTGTGHTITVALSQTEPLVMSIAALSGDNIYSPIDTYSSIIGDNGTQGEYIFGSPLTTSQPNDLVLGFVKGFGNNSYTPGAGYTAQPSSTGLNFSAETMTAASAGSYGSSFTASIGDFWQTVAAAIAPKPTETILSWNASTGGIIANYYVERCAGLGCSAFAQIVSLPSSTMTYTDTTISPGTVYNYRVRAQNTVGTFSNYSNVLLISPITPYVVSGFSVTPLGGLSWNASAEPGGSISQYSIERCTGVGCSNFSQIATTSSTSYTDTSATRGATYIYRVRAQDTNSLYGPYSTAVTVTIPAYLDNATDGGNNGGNTTSLNYPFTVGTNANRLLIVNLIGDTSADDISSVTYAGAPMTLLTKVQSPSDRWQYLYYLLSPATGTNNVVITAASAHYLISEAASWYNIAQSGQPGARATNTSTGTSLTMSLPASSNNAIVVESMWGYTGLYPSGGTAPLVVDSALAALGIFSSVPSPVTQAYPVYMTNTWGGQASASGIIASFTLASNGTAGITYDNSADGGNNSGSTASLTYPYTVGTGANRVLVVNLIGDTAADDIGSVTYGGTAMTLVGKVQAPSNNWQYLYYLLSPSSGTHNIIVTAGSSHYLISQAASWYNVKQTAQPDASTTNTAPATTTSSTTSLTTFATGALVVEGLWSYGHLAAGAGATPIVTDATFNAGAIFVSSGSPVSPAGNVSMTTISDGSISTGVIMASFAPAP